MLKIIIMFESGRHVEAYIFVINICKMDFVARYRLQKSL